ncbi:hypothetical protein J4468_02640 [Candidatus Woesearchaeota archaeon]|nr:hypothetical protein [Candidatus Woesearchaeota archaeon]
MEEKLLARIIIEVLGGPKEHLETVIKNVVERLKKENGLKIISDKIFPIEQVDKLFTTFAEIEFESENPKTLINICFDYMPSSIEILSPKNIKFDALDFVEFFNDLLARLHKSDMVVKNVNAQNIMLRKELLKLKEEKE